MLTIKIIGDGVTQTLKIPAKLTKTIIIDQRDYPQEDDSVTIARRVRYYRNLCKQRTGIEGVDLITEGILTWHLN